MIESQPDRMDSSSPTFDERPELPSGFGYLIALSAGATAWYVLATLVTWASRLVSTVADKPPEPARKTPAPTRAEREAAALRENLLRRKQQARQRKDAPGAQKPSLPRPPPRLEPAHRCEVPMPVMPDHWIAAWRSNTP